MKAPAPATVARRIRIPVDRWPGNCHGIASACLKAKVVRGRLCYGSWLGPVADGSPFAGRPLSRHGWVELPDGQVWDPTRWVFEHVTPYIYIGRSDHYDFGSNRVNEFLRAEIPVPPRGKPELTLTLPVAASLRVGPLLALQPEDFTLVGRGRAAVDLTLLQAHYLANTPLHHLAEQAKPIYRALVAAGRGVLIPMDNRERVLGRR